MCVCIVKTMKRGVHYKTSVDMLQKEKGEDTTHTTSKNHHTYFFLLLVFVESSSSQGHYFCELHSILELTYIIITTYRG